MNWVPEQKPIPPAETETTSQALDREDFDQTLLIGAMEYYTNELNNGKCTELKSWEYSTSSDSDFHIHIFQFSIYSIVFWLFPMAQQNRPSCHLGTSCLICSLFIKTNEIWIKQFQWACQLCLVWPNLKIFWLIWTIHWTVKWINFCGHISYHVCPEHKLVLPGDSDQIF